MLSRTIAYLMEFDSFVHLLAEALACRAVRRMEGSVVTICAAAAADLSVAVRAGKAGIKHDLLEPLPISALEISYEGIVSLSVRKAIFLKILWHIRQN